MSEPLRQRWTWNTYLEWEARQEIRHEFVDGQVRAMTGGTAAHNAIANQLRMALYNALRGRPCRSDGPDMKVVTGNGNARYPDALVDCGPYSPDALVAQIPAAVFEVLSRSTAWVDQGLKLRDYEATPTIRHYVLVSQDEMRAMIYSRDSEGRLDILNAALVEGPDAVIVLAGIDISLPLAVLYEGALG